MRKNYRLISSIFLTLLILTSLVYLNLQSSALDFKRSNYKANNGVPSLKEVLKRLIKEDINKPINYLYSTYVAGRILRIKCSLIPNLLGVDPRHVFVLALINNSWRNLPIRIYESKLVANVGTRSESIIYLIPRKISSSTVIDIKLPSLPPKLFNLSTKKELMKLPRYVMNGEVIPIYLIIRITESKSMNIELLIAISLTTNTEVIKNSIDYKYVSEYYDVYGVNGFYNKLVKAADEGVIKASDINKLVREYECSTVDIVTMKVLPSIHPPEPPTYEPTIIEIVPPWRTWGTNATLGINDELRLKVKYILKPPEISDNVETVWVTAHILVRDLEAPNQTTTTTPSTSPPSLTTTSTTTPITSTTTKTSSTTSTSTSTTSTKTSTSTTKTSIPPIPTFTPPPRKFTTTFTPTITISPPTSFTIMSKIHPKAVGNEVCELIIKYYEGNILKETDKLVINNDINDFKITYYYPDTDNVRYDLTLKGCKGRWEISILSLSVAHYYPKILESNLTNKPVNLYFIGSEEGGYGIIDLPRGVDNLTAQLPTLIPEGIAIVYDKFYNEKLPNDLRFLIRNRCSSEVKVTVCLGSTKYLCNSTYIPASSSTELVLSVNKASEIVDYFATQSNLPLIVNVVRSNSLSKGTIEIFPEHSLITLLARPLYLAMPELSSSTYYASTLYPDNSNLWELQATIKGVMLSNYLFGIYKSEGGFTISLYGSALNEHVFPGSTNDLYFDLLFNGAYAKVLSSNILENDWGIHSFRLIIKYPNLDKLSSDNVKYYLILPSSNPLIKISFPQLPPIVSVLTSFIAVIAPGINLVATIIGTAVSAYSVVTWIWDHALKPALYSKPTLHRDNNELIISWKVGPLQSEPYILALRVKLFEVPMYVMKPNVGIALNFLATSGRYSLSDELQGNLVLNPLK